MQWVREREEWLADWADATCIKEIQVGSQTTAETAAEDDADIFFSEALELGGRCWIARANGKVVEVFDISPGADSLACWRVCLPSPIERDVGVAHSVSADGLSLALMLLARGGTVHRISFAVRAGGQIDVTASGSTVCTFISRPAAFCALSPELAAVGCFDGSLHIAKLCSGGGPEHCREHYELTNAALLARLVGGIMHTTNQHPILALAAAGAAPSSGFHPLGGSSTRLLSFAGDSHVRLWEAGDRKGRLVASQALAPASEDVAAAYTLAGGEITRIRMSPSKSRACLVFGHTAYIIDLPISGVSEGLTIQELWPEPFQPFPRASPCLLAMADDSIWAMWSGQSRDQLFRADQRPDDRHWGPRWLDAAGAQAETSPEQVVRMAADGSDPEPFGSHQVIFMLDQQQKVWKIEEDNYDAMAFAEAAEAWIADASTYAGAAVSNDATVLAASTPKPEELALKWWVSRIFIPGRFAASVIATGLAQVGGRVPPPSQDGLPISHCELRNAVETHLRNRTVLQCSYAAPDAHAVPGGISAAAARISLDGPGPFGLPAYISHVQVANALASEAFELRRCCDAAWAKSSQLCGLATSCAWGFHLWYPAGCLPEGEPLDRGATSCLLLLKTGSVSCVRPMHSWPERWWATFYYSNELSLYDLNELPGGERVGLDTLIGLSDLDEWKLCATAWFLSLCSLHVGGFGLALAALPHGVTASTVLLRMLQDMPSHLAHEVRRAASSMTGPGAKQHLDNIAATLGALISDQQQRCVPVGDRNLDLNAGMWSTRFGTAVQVNPGGVILSDTIRGSIALSECEHACVAMRDLQLLCLFASQAANEMHVLPGSAPAAPLGSPGDWATLEELLNGHVLLYYALADSLKCEAPARAICTPAEQGESWRFAAKKGTPLAARGCDLWASGFRSILGGGQTVFLRTPLASFRSFQFAMVLLAHERWDGLRSWLRHQSSQEFVAYIAGRELLTLRRPVAAKQAFLQAEPEAKLLTQCLPKGDVAISLPQGMPAALYFSSHCASLFHKTRDHEEELFFLSRAVQIARGAPVMTHQARQQVLSTYFERAIDMQSWDDACDVLKEMDPYSTHLRNLGKRLRATGSVDVVHKLLPEHKEKFLVDLYENATVGNPASNADARQCFRLLYALHFSNRDYLKAAAVAHLFYTSLSRSHERLIPAGRGKGACAPAAWFRAGDCVSDPRLVPRACREDGVAVGTELDALGIGAAKNRRADDAVVDLLQLQRNALLMLVSALSLTSEHALVLPSPHELTHEDARAMPPASLVFHDNAAGEAIPDDAMVCDDEDPELNDLRGWFSSGQDSTGGSVFTVDDARRLLALVEGQLVFQGRTQVQTPSDMARGLASVGLLVLAVQIATTHGLDLWHAAFQPFTKLCLEAGDANEGSTRAKVWADVAVGEGQSYMFVRGDSMEPLCGGSLEGGAGHLAEGLWQSLDGCLRAVARNHERGKALDAQGARLYSLVADAVLAGSSKPLPSWLSDPLSSGGSWICLLRLYMKHRRVQDAATLLDEAVQGNADMGPGLARLAGASAAVRYPLQDLHLGLVAQLREGAADATLPVAGRAADDGDSSPTKKCTAEAAWLHLERVLQSAEQVCT